MNGDTGRRPTTRREARSAAALEAIKTLDDAEQNRLLGRLCWSAPSAVLAEVEALRAARQVTL